MKYLSTLILLIATALGAFGASPSYSNFNSNDFTTNTVVGGQISLRVNPTNFPTVTNQTLTILSNLMVNVNVFISNSAYISSNLFVSNAFVVYGQNLSNLLYWGTNDARGTITNRSANGIDVSGNAKFAGRITNDVLTANMLVGTDGSTPPALKSTTTPASSWIPVTGYEIWYEAFNGGDNATGLGGMLGWSPTGSGSCNFSNAANHWGTINITTAVTGGTTESLFNSDTFQTKPTIPPLNSTTGWTNRFIWRMNNTNSVRAYMVLQNGAFTFAQEPTNAIGLYMITTNATIGNQIMGFTSGGALGNFSTTNLGTLVDGQWHTNEIWCTTGGVISFNMDGGAEATLNSNIPTTALTPAFGILKPTTTAATSSLEIDEWVLIWVRTP